MYLQGVFAPTASTSLQQPAITWDPNQFDFSGGSLKSHKALTLYFGPAEVQMKAAQARGFGGRQQGGAMLSSHAGAAGRLAPRPLPGHAGMPCRRFLAALCQDEALSEIFEQVGIKRGLKREGGGE